MALELPNQDMVKISKMMAEVAKIILETNGQIAERLEEVFTAKLDEIIKLQRETNRILEESRGH